VTVLPSKVVLPGGAGLVGQNLVAKLKVCGYDNIVVLDKHAANLAALQRLHPEVTCELADLAIMGEWRRHFDNAHTVVMLQAQIGGLSRAEFVRNNLQATQNILSEVKQRNLYTVHISSSVVESIADDLYTQTKRDQEKLILASGVACAVLRPTLMFGWFDRKHLGWLSRFMHKTPIFPIPGNGKYMRQPLYAGDLCSIIISCIETHAGGIYNISGQTRIDYIDIIREIKRATRARTVILKIPYGLFQSLLWLWARFDRNPPFTTQQLAALVASDEFEVIDWPGLFGVSPTPFAQAIDETFNHPIYSKIALEF
jgi:nucleoside-diphosphate-sugar epimerase